MIKDAQDKTTKRKDVAYAPAMYFVRILSNWIRKPQYSDGPVGKFNFFQCARFPSNIKLQTPLEELIWACPIY